MSLHIAPNAEGLVPLKRFKAPEVTKDQDSLCRICTSLLILPQSSDSTETSNQTGIFYQDSCDALTFANANTFGPKSAAKPTLLNIIIIMNMQRSSRTLFVGLFEAVII